MKKLLIIIALASATYSYGQTTPIEPQKKNPVAEWECLISYFSKSGLAMPVNSRTQAQQFNVVPNDSGYTVKVPTICTYSDSTYIDHIATDTIPSYVQFYIDSTTQKAMTAPIEATLKALIMDAKLGAANSVKIE
ncbi:hypothetical protein JYU20_00460 [Bacteroidales bacterium AH-315-I05]|nr:hypothetical protein [Bacteroidales bacterium AH-315-I05]